MAEMISNDNDAARARARLPEPDAHGQAAMLLTESLLHGLIARDLITVRDAVEIVEVAAEVKEAIADDLGDSPDTMQRSLALLGSIRVSLTNDLGG
jgi:hypothetical protein